MNSHNVPTSVFSIVLLLLLIISGIIIYPFFTPIVFGLLLAFVFYPLHEILKKKVKNEILSVAIITALVLILLLFPIALVVGQLSVDASVLYTTATQT